MDKKEKKFEQEQRDLNKFNSVTEKKKPVNQNQTFNVRKEGISNINQNR